MEEVGDVPEDNLAHTFTLVRAKNKKKKLKQSSGYITISKVGTLTYLKSFVFSGTERDCPNPALGWPSIE